MCCWCGCIWLHAVLDISLNLSHARPHHVEGIPPQHRTGGSGSGSGAAWEHAWCPYPGLSLPCVRTRVRAQVPMRGHGAVLTRAARCGVHRPLPALATTPCQHMPVQQPPARGANNNDTAKHYRTGLVRGGALGVAPLCLLF